MSTLPAGGDGTPVMRSIGRVLLTGLQLRFRAQKAPDGTPWKPSQRVKREGGQTLRDTGMLRDSFSASATSSRAQVGTNSIKAAIHQFGGTIKHPGGTRYVIVDGMARFVSNSLVGPVSGVTKPHPIDMPARPMLGDSDADRLEILSVLETHFKGRWSQ
ncbi:phage virion morphogenesis protein [Polaromonas sp. JS666]|uniref:phage virion morphogenesis protein n=1 Tax=Polaromonas sp. (strain JS666 / ATCC BAA-500) TaxID=296591 RepID=UPI0000464B36|nr:phage virion morphogenesis protein [Polaromonas sp. JS666]